MGEGGASADPVGSVDGTGAFIEQSGVAVFEIESLAPNEIPNGWELRQDEPVFTGDGYLVWTQGGGLPNTIQGDVLSYPVRIQTPGVYQLHIYSHQLGAEWHGNNDVLVRIPTATLVPGAADMADGGGHKVYVGSERDNDAELLNDREARQRVRELLVGDWRWWIWTEEPRAPIRVELDAGVHRIEIGARSQLFAIDRAILIRWNPGDPEQPVGDTVGQWAALPQSLREAE